MIREKRDNRIGDSKRLRTATLEIVLGGHGSPCSSELPVETLLVQVLVMWTIA